MRTDEEVRQAIDRYGDTVRRVCLVHLKNRADTEDIFQTVFLKYALRADAFESRDHERAWFLRVTINACKDLLKSLFRRSAVPLDELIDLPAETKDEHREVLEAVLALPEKYRDVIYLHFYEGYTAPEIGALLGRNTNSVYTRLDRAKKLLRQALGGDGDGR